MNVLNRFDKWYCNVSELTQYAKNTLNQINILSPFDSNSVIIFDIDGTFFLHNGKHIIQTINLFNYAKKLGLTPVIITNRIGNQQTIDDTKAQLINYYIQGYKYIYFRNPAKDNDPYKYKKNTRINIHERGMTVIMSIGDKSYDFGEYAGIGIILPKYPTKS
jgi:hypothetical protein